MIPFTTAERKVLGVAAPTQAQTQFNCDLSGAAQPLGLQPQLTGYVNQIYVQAANQTDVQPALGQVTETLARRHHIKPGDVNDFSVRNLSQIAETAEGSSRIMALLLATVASISLVVGGIGIMNILLVSVTERTREIGLRMAIGARRLHVLLQFLAEAVFLSVIGGVAGIVMGVAFSPSDLGGRRLADAGLADGDRRRLPVLGRGRNLLRLLPGAQGRPPRSDRGAALRVRQHSLQHAVTADEVVIECRQLRAGRPASAADNSPAVQCTSPVQPQPGARVATSLRQFKSEHHDRHAAPGGVDPAENRQHEQQCIQQPMHDARRRGLPGRHAVVRLGFAVRHPPGEPHDRDREDDDADGEMQADQRGDRRVAAECGMVQATVNCTISSAMISQCRNFAVEV